MNKTEKHPSEYNYKGDEKISITVNEFQVFARLADIILLQETKAEYNEKYHYVNKENSEVIKTITDKNKHLAVKVFDWEKTKSSEPTISYTPMGMEALNMKYVVQGIHLRNIEEGTAKHISELNPQLKEEDEMKNSHKIEIEDRIKFLQREIAEKPNNDPRDAFEINHWKKEIEALEYKLTNLK